MERRGRNEGPGCQNSGLVELRAVVFHGLLGFILICTMRWTFQRFGPGFACGRFTGTSFKRDRMGLSNSLGQEKSRYNRRIVRLNCLTARYRKSIHLFTRRMLKQGSTGRRGSTVRGSACSIMSGRGDGLGRIVDLLSRISDSPNMGCRGTPRSPPGYWVHRQT